MRQGRIASTFIVGMTEVLEASKRRRLNAAPAPSASPPCLSLDAIGGHISGAGDLKGLLSAQLEAVNALYRVYKVDHYALLEELRLRHAELKGKPAVVAKAAAAGEQDDMMTSQSSGKSKGLKAAMSMREFVRAQRAAAGHAQAAMVVKPEPPPHSAVPPPKPEEPTSPLPPAAGNNAASSASSDPAVGMSPGISLNLWMAAPTSASTLTPQSVRQSSSAMGGLTEGARQNQQGMSLRYGDEVVGYGSDDDPAEFTEIEEALLQSGPSVSSGGGAAPVTAKDVERWRQRFTGSYREVGERDHGGGE